MITVVFVRHGAKVTIPGKAEYDFPLDPNEAPRLAKFADGLAAAKWEPTLWIASHFEHCWATAQQLARHDARVVRVCGLTPWSANEGFTPDRIVQEANELGADVLDAKCIGIVGHETRLSQLATMMMKHSVATTARLDKTEAVAARAVTLGNLCAGYGKLALRWTP